MKTFRHWLIALAVTLFAHLASAQGHDVYFVGVDGWATIPTGTYAGQPNPNFGRLTLLLAHYTPGTEHYHPIGIWSYAGDPANPQVVDTNTNNRLPELYQRPTGQEYIYLYPGSGAFSGFYRSGIIRNPALEEYSNLLMQPTTVLASSTDPAVQRLYNSSGGRWTGLLGDARIGLRVVDITPGLRITLEDGTPILAAVGNVYEIGAGDLFAFSPVFSVDANAPVQVYSASFQLIDLNNTLGYRPLRDSGIFHFDFYPVPEPSTMAVLGMGVVGMWLYRRRR